MPLPDSLKGRLRLPLVAAPMFLASSPSLVIAQCRAGVLGSMPALNLRSTAELDDALSGMIQALAGYRSAPFAINQILAPANTRLDADLDLMVRHRVPVIITSVGAPGDVVQAVHGYGGLVFHDVVTVRHAEKAVAAGVDGLVLVCAGAGGHGGQLNPFAFISEVRQFFQGTVLLAGAMSRGVDLLAAQLLGADLGYMGTRFLATRECQVDPVYQRMLVQAKAEGIINSNLFSGLPANYLAASVERAGLDPARLPSAQTPGVGTGGHGEYRVWRDIWGAGQGVGNIHDVPDVEALVTRMEQEYCQALKISSQRTLEAWA